MSKYVYHNKKLRCRITYGMKRYILKIQKRRFLVWFSEFGELTVSEGFWGENHAPCINPMILPGTCGDDHEVYKTGTMNLKARAKQLLRDYIEDERKNKANQRVLDEL